MQFEIFMNKNMYINLVRINPSPSNIVIQLALGSYTNYLYTSKMQNKETVLHLNLLVLIKLDELKEKPNWT